MKFIGIVGTNADFSYNRLLLNFMKRHFLTKAEINIEEIKYLPLFNESACSNISPEVTQLSEKIMQADGVIISTPEYDHAIPAALKSALEWLSYISHPFKDKPVMIVGASYGPQGSSRAQINLRQIIDSPGIGALTLPGNEFLLKYCKDAFDEQNNLYDKTTITFLESCFNNFIQYAETMDMNKIKLENN